MKIIHQHNGKWYFWYETWTDRSGPYDSKEKAEKMFWKYINQELAK